MTVIGELMVTLGIDDAKFKESLKSTENRLGKLQNKMSSAGKAMTMSLTPAILGTAVAAVKVADDFDKAYSIIRAGTGATGEALEEMKNITDELYGELPNDLEDVAQAVADVNTMMDLNGEAQKEMAETMLNLARLTKTDVNTVIKTTSRLFGDWTIATEDQSNALNYLWNVSQSTGIEFTTLNQRMVTSGASLRALGFDFETAAALMGKFEKEGVNVDTILSSLKMGLGRMAKEGVTDATEAFQSLIDEIKTANTEMEAISLAVDVFGSRAGPELALAIREGRFDLENYISSLKNSDETIGAAGDETRTFSDELKTLKHQAELALQPLGEVIVETLLENKDDLEDVVGIFRGLAEGFRDLPDPIQGATLKILAFTAALGPLLWMLPKLIGFASGVKGALITVGSGVADAAFWLTTTTGTTMAGITAAAYAYADLTRRGIGTEGWSEMWKNMPSETQMYQPWGGETVSYGMPLYSEKIIKSLDKVEKKYNKVVTSIRENGIIDAINEDIKSTKIAQIEADIVLMEDEKTKIRTELEEALDEINITFAGKFSDKTLRYLEQMQNIDEGYSLKYDIGTSFGLAFAIDSLTNALDPSRLREMGYSDEQIAELQESVAIAQDQLTTQSNIEALAQAAVDSSGLSAEEAEITKEYISDILETAEAYKTDTGALMEEANNKISTINENIATAKENIATIESYQADLATSGDIQDLATALENMPQPEYTINIDITTNDKGGISNDLSIPTMATGGYTGNYEGLAYLHPDEYVIPGDKMIRTTATDVPHISKLVMSPIINVNHAMTQREYEEITERMLTATEKSLRRRGLTLNRGGLQ